MDLNSKHLTRRGEAYYELKDFSSERLISRIGEIIEEDFEPTIDLKIFLESREIVLGIIDILNERKIK